MGMLRKALVTAVATKLVEEARKPENQRRLRELVANVRARQATRSR